MHVRKTKDYCKTNAWVDSGPDIDICIEQWVCILGDVLGNESRIIHHIIVNCTLISKNTLIGDYSACSRGSVAICFAVQVSLAQSTLF